MADVEMKIASVGKRGVKRRSSKSPKSKRRLVFKSPAVQKGVNVEKKWVDTTTGNKNFSLTGAFSLINGLQRGTDVYQRVGRRIKIVSINIRGLFFVLQDGAVPSIDYLRMMLVYDREPNGSLPNLNEILQDTSEANATSTNSISHMNLVNSDRFAIIKDWSIAIPAKAASGTSAPSQSLLDNGFAAINWNKKVNLDVKYNSGTVGDVTDITTGSLFLVFVGLETTANSQFGAQMQCRIRFTDS